MRKATLKMWPLVLALALLASACNGGGAEPEPGLPDDGEDVGLGEGQDTQTDRGNGKLAQVRERGELICGINDVVPGFGFIGEDGEPEGFDVDLCRAIAAAVLGDAEAVQFRPVAVAERFTTLQADEIDVLSRNTTWTAARDGTEGAAFVTTTYYDGQGMMVRAADGFGSIDDMQNTVICTLEGTTTELNLATRFAGIPYEPATFSDTEDIQEAFIADACDGWTSDLSQLAARRAVFPEEAGGPESLVIFDEVFSKEPLGPAVADGDQEWFDVVNWTVIGLIQAEEFGITSDNLAEFDDTENLDIRRFLGLPGIEGEDEGVVFDPGLGLDTDFNRTVIEQVGNYGELFERHLGPDTPLGLERGTNALWTDGGLLYAPPYR
ncbi:MAG TPA: amino acid ABC transporter substrate-binding protein [Egibacteraceae bacterium]|nr:amino acid ABC transporter substrate-binding protein [Egibacteraceae bacterium]